MSIEITSGERPIQPDKPESAIATEQAISTQPPAVEEKTGTLPSDVGDRYWQDRNYGAPYDNMIYFRHGDQRAAAAMGGVWELIRKTSKNSK